jgi:glutamate/aspartate transport system substrate-binding protein
MSFKKGLLCMLVTGACVAITAQAQELTGTLKKIKETGVVSLGYRDAYLPFSYLNDKQEPLGYTLDICQKIVGALKQELQLSNLQTKYVSVVAASRTPLLVNHTIDLECGVTTNTLDRQKQIGFLTTSYVASAKFVAKKSSGLKSVADLKGKAVVVVTGTTGEKIAKELDNKQGMGLRMLQAKDGAEAFIMLETGRASAYINDDALIFGAIANNKRPDDFHLLAEALSEEPYGIAIRKDDLQFKAFADKVIRGLYTSGEINQIYKRWFEQPVPPRNVVLNVPMGPALKNAIANPNDKGI